MKIDYPCALHPDARSLQISKCATFHQLCGPCWTAAYKSGHCPCCQDVLMELMPEPICEYRIGKFKLATIFYFRHRLPCELLDEMIKFCGLECFPRVAFFCRPKNVNILVANSTLNVMMTKQIKLKADFYFKSILMTLLIKIRIRDRIRRLRISEQLLEVIAAKMLRKKGKFMSRYGLLENEKGEIREKISGLLSSTSILDLEIADWEIKEEMIAMKIIDKEKMCNPFLRAFYDLE